MWVISDFKYYESTTGWLFAVTRKFGVNLVALEPLPPKSDAPIEDCVSSINQLQQALPKGPLAFVAVGKEFAGILNYYQFYNLQFGSEPWVMLSNYEPKGQYSRGIRAAKNQAIRFGVEIENCSLNNLFTNPVLKHELETVEKNWREKDGLDLNGFLLKTNPWKLMDIRRCFVARNKGGPIEGVLIATPVGPTKNWYFEDMWLTSHTTRGTGELLTLTAMAAIKAEGGENVSLGLIPFTNINSSFNNARVNRYKPSFFLMSVKLISRFLKLFYNADGLTLFRKRFKIKEWNPSYISVKTLRYRNPSLQWIQVVIAIILAHNPEIKLPFYQKSVRPILVKLHLAH